MACCSVCATASSRSKYSYLIYLVDDETGRWGQCVVQSACPHGMQEWAEQLAAQAVLYVVDENDEKFLMSHPRVIHVDAEKAAHIPIVDLCEPGCAS